MAETKIVFYSRTSCYSTVSPFPLLLHLNLIILGSFTLFFFVSAIVWKRNHHGYITEATIFLNFVWGVLDLNKPLTSDYSSFGVRYFNPTDLLLILHTAAHCPRTETR
ncbi:hypothetical protein BDE02_05G152900 [Populus trichocarpa]|jgi:hypothetical protein|nr:hypothetical protein BDE02_05G152900 [Populus trichocarpa]